MPVLFLNTESEVELGQFASHVGAVDDDPTLVWTTASPVKLASLETATSPAAAFEGEPGEAASVIATGVAITATSTRRRCLARDTCRFMCVLAPMSADPVPGSPGH